MQAINDQKAEWRLMSANQVFVNRDASRKPEPARIEEVQEAMEKMEIKEEKLISVGSHCSMQQQLRG